MAQQTNATAEGAETLPTATEFIPAGEVAGPRDLDKPQARILKRVREGKGLEIASHEPYDDSVKNHVYICDECGHDEPTESGIEHHLRTKHDNDL
jgi:hypothetical protein